MASMCRLARPELHGASSSSSSSASGGGGDACTAILVRGGRGSTERKADAVLVVSGAWEGAIGDVATATVRAATEDCGGGGGVRERGDGRAAASSRCAAGGGVVTSGSVSKRSAAGRVVTWRVTSMGPLARRTFSGTAAEAMGAAARDCAAASAARSAGAGHDSAALVSSTVVLGGAGVRAEACAPRVLGTAAAAVDADTDADAPVRRAPGTAPAVVRRAVPGAALRWDCAGSVNATPSVRCCRTRWCARSFSAWSDAS